MPPIHFNGKTYNDLAEMPATEREAYEQLMSIFNSMWFFLVFGIRTRTIIHKCALSCISVMSAAEAVVRITTTSI